MNITKLGHCAIVLDIGGVRLLTDPGSYSIEVQSAQTGIDAVLITHEHQDHFHIDSLKTILRNNPQAVVITNTAVGALLDKEGVAHTVIGDGQAGEVKGVRIEGFGKDHALVYPPNMGLVENTGYFIADVFYFPGDNFYNPGKAVDILALPTAGPWMKMSEAIDFVRELKPRVAFNVHDATSMPFFRGWIGKVLEVVAPQTQFVTLADGETRIF